MKHVVDQWVRDHIADPMNRARAEVREQLVKAIEAAPGEAAKVRAWFEEHIKKAPLVHDTELFNVIHRAIVELEARLKASAAKPAAAPKQ